MPTTVRDDDLARWAAFGGQVDDKLARKAYIAPNGKKLRTWKEAKRLMEDAEEGKEGVHALMAFSPPPAVVSI